MVKGMPVIKYGAFVLHSHLKGYHNAFISKLKGLYKSKENEESRENHSNKENEYSYHEI